MLAVLLILVVLAILLPALGVATDPNLSRIIAILVAVALLVWLFTGGLPSLR